LRASGGETPDARGEIKPEAVMKIKLALLSILPTVMLAVGCVGQMLEPCIVARVPINFELNPSHEDQLSESVEMIDVYVFDQRSGLLVRVLPVDRGSIERGYFDISDLPDGVYTFVAWGDSDADMSRSFMGVQLDDAESGEYSEVRVGVTKLSNFYMMLGYDVLPENVAGDVTPIVNDFDDLFFARARDVRITSGVSTTVELSFVRNANTLKIRLGGLDKVRLSREPKTREEEDTPPLNVFVLAKNGRYNIDNEIDSHAQIVRYEPQYLDYNVDGNSMTVYVKTMRIDLVRHNLDPVLLYIQTPQGVDIIPPVDILKAILQIRDGDGEPVFSSQDALDSQQEFEIDVEFEYTGSKLSVTITINDWEIEILDPITNPEIVR
jgi:hypothetical protein